MIRYALACQKGHEFEGWFGSSGDFDTQQEKGLLECPYCGSHDISKTLMAPSVSTSRKRGEASSQVPAEDASPTAEQASVQLAGMTQEQRAILGQMRELKEKLLSQAENVGERFSEEARKIHYGETEQRGIYGKATLDEATELAEEGIDFLPLPDLPEDRN
ncbi:MAG: DUF1178 family protein [Salaquimonas sp.]|jgi:hypothetical protein|nr:DUF1178 family protein [Salaquimonas sp.]